MRKLLVIAACSLLAFSPALAQAQTTTSQQSCDSSDQNGPTSNNNNNNDLCSPVLWIVGTLALVGATVGIVAATNSQSSVSP
jgi:hypothetical protein